MGDQDEPASDGSRHLRSRVLASGKWLRLEEVDYVNEDGKEASWEMVSRNTGERDRRKTADEVAVAALLKRKDEEDRFVFVWQYRPPVKRYTWEFPAGLVDAGESPAEAALRELKEETGFGRGRVVSCGPPVCLDAGISDTTVSIVEVELDGSDPKNVGGSSAKELEEGEFTEVRLVAVSEVRSFLEEVAAAGADVVHSCVYSYFRGMDFGRRANTN